MDNQTISATQTEPPDGEDRMLREELATVATRRETAKKLHQNLQDGAPSEGPYTVGLALSGGGIRSATVSLGILQKLAGAGLLKHVDYLSTVSGGGYIGSALTWWLLGNARGEPEYESRHDTGDRFPFGTSDPRLPEPADRLSDGKDQLLTPLQYLRVQGNYLAPGNGISVWSGIAVVARAILLNLLIWVPVATLIIGLVYALGWLPILNGLPFAVHMAAPGTLEAAATVVGTSGQLDLNETIPSAFLLMLVVALALVGLFILGSINHSLLSWTSLTESSAQKKLAEATRPAEKSKWYSWLLVGLVALAGIVLLVVTVLWLQAANKVLFADADSELVLELPAMTTGIILWVIALFGSVFATAYINRRTLTQGLKIEDYRASGTALLGLLAILVSSTIADHIVPDKGWPILGRLPEFLLFVYGVAFLAFAAYLIGILIRHLLRSEPVGNPLPDMQSPTPALLQYRARRVFEWFFGRILFWIIVLIILGSLPLVSHYINYRLGGVWAALGLGITLAGQLVGRLRGHSRFTKIIILIGAALFAYGVLLVSHRLALTFMDGEPMQRALIGAAVIAALIGGWFVNTNHIGLHRFYRDRLMEAFLPDADTLHGDVNAAAAGANERKLVDCWNEAWSKGPYQIINANAVLTNSTQRKYRLRGGDNFILTPEFIGSSATGWYRTAESANADLTLASAMAISGAAANPRGAAGGRGLTRSAFVSLAMSLLNVRLGYWIPNPRYGVPSFLMRRPNHFWPSGAYAATQSGYTETAKWLEIADGGHFENLGIYELVRRRCGLIIVCDGGRDNASSYKELVTSVQCIGQDFGATIHFDMQVKKRDSKNKFEGSSPAQMIASSELTDYPKGAEFAEKGYFVARIDYGDRGNKGWPQTGILIYMKSTLIPDLAIGAKGYRGAHHDFPNESTGDQFFEEDQFEAYREVGYRICEQMIGELDLAELFKDGPPPLAKLRQNDRFKTPEPPRSVVLTA
jgi:hypothetical protein